MDAKKSYAASQLVDRISHMENVVTINPRVLGGTPCFAGTRVPVKSLFDHLEGGYNVDYFLTQFPSINREQIHAVLENSRHIADREAMIVAGK